MTLEGKRPAGQGPLYLRKSRAVSPALVGARWWQEGLARPVDPQSRRRLLTWALGGVGALMVGGPIAAALLGRRQELRSRDALEAQRAHGWSLGSEGEPIEFEGATGATFERYELASLAEALRPRQQRLVPYYVPTLFGATQEEPAQPTGGVARLAEVLRPIATPAMATARARGEALASLFEGAPAGKAVIVDLPGPEAVAFAAGLAGQLEPVFLFDNWPHPRGVVKSHLTLAAAASLWAPLQQAGHQRKADAPPAFVLDRARLTPYVDDAGQFDNRYLARLPSAQALKGLGVSEVLYVTPDGDAKESDDLVDDFVAFHGAGIAVKTVAATDFSAAPADEEEPRPLGQSRGTGAQASGAPLAASSAGASPADGASQPDAGPQPARTHTVYRYGGSYYTHYGFWPRYGWGVPYYTYREPAFVSRGWEYVPSRRSTLFSGGVSGARARPSSFGQVATVVENGRVVGAHFGRSGSLGRGSWTGS
jgi:hypothetical protein